MEVAPMSPNETKTTVDKEVYWLSYVFYKTAYCVLLLSWINYLIASFARYKHLYLEGLSNSSSVSDDADQLPYDEDAYPHTYTYLPHLEMRDVAASFLLVTFYLKHWPESIHQIHLPIFSGTIIKRRNRVAQTTGPYLKRFGQGLRHLEDVSNKLKTDKGKVTGRWKKVFTKYAMAEKMLLCDIRSKEKLIGFLRAKMQCSLVSLKEVTSSVKISRDRLEVQREENKAIIDQLEYFTQLAQIRQ